MTAAGQEQGGREFAQAAPYHADPYIVPVHVAVLVDTGGWLDQDRWRAAGRRPS